MLSKNKKRKIFIPKGVKLRKCSVQLGQINKLLSRINSAKRKTLGKQLHIGTPPPPGTKLIRVKNDLFKKSSTPQSSGSSERVSKRTPKPNRRYVNEETLNSSTWHDKNVSSDEQSEEEDVDSRKKIPQTEPTRKNRNRTAVPKTVGGIVHKELDKGALTKRKIDYESDEKSAAKQLKKVSELDFMKCYDCVYEDE